jgi:hypothetical protein
MGASRIQSEPLTTQLVQHLKPRTMHMKSTEGVTSSACLPYIEGCEKNDELVESNALQRNEVLALRSESRDE